MNIRSPLGRMQPTPVDYENIKRRAWRDDGILVVDVNNVIGLSWPDRQHLRNIGDRLYGRRVTGGAAGGEAE